MNVHHLELFYYVARHGGVSAAARAMPYGIQQPAISAQILQLEASRETGLKWFKQPQSGVKWV
jgi:DNA-binding transcriptional LysR family regulator